jgi:YVTN family beta-propeller protein
MTDSGSNCVYVFDTVTNTVIHTVPVGSLPDEIAIVKK